MESQVQDAVDKLQTCRCQLFGPELQEDGTFQVSFVPLVQIVADEFAPASKLELVPKTKYIFKREHDGLNFISAVHARMTTPL